MATGRVKWFDGEKGFGFIGQDSGGEDVFVHVKNLAIAGFKTLREGQAVSFSVEQGKKGLQAIDVKLLHEKTKEYFGQG